MEIQSLNNATIYIKSESCSILIDPWLIGDLYGGAWSPFSKLRDLSFLNSVNYVFISHIHEDHWDLATLELVPRNATILIPKMLVNKVIENKLRELGFTLIQMVELNKIFCINEYISLKVISPLNTFAQDFDRYEDGYEYDATNVDTSLLLTDVQSKSSHLFLCDNSPYDLKKLIAEINVDLTTFWYPFNSYAQDYPICYENLSENDKQLIHDEMHKKRVDATAAAINQLSPKYCLPHSADFVLNGPLADLFVRYTSNDFIDRARVAKRYGLNLKNHAVQSEYLDSGDVMIIIDGDICIKRNVNDWDKVEPIASLPPFKTEVIADMKYVLSDAFDKMLERATRFDVDISGAEDWVIILSTESTQATFCFNKKKLSIDKSIDLIGRKILRVSLSDKQLSALIMRELHWNNAMIGCHLRFSRIPNEFCQSVYKVLNFLHT